jgi:hypothetical protein
MIEFEDGEKKMEGEGGVGGELFVEDEVDLLLAHADDLCAVKEAVGHDVIDLAGLGSQHAGKVYGLIAGEAGSGGSPGVGDEAATGHALSLERNQSRRTFSLTEKQKTK